MQCSWQRDSAGDAENGGCFGGAIVGYDEGGVQCKDRD